MYLIKEALLVQGLIEQKRTTNKRKGTATANHNGFAEL